MVTGSGGSVGRGGDWEGGGVLGIGATADGIRDSGTGGNGTDGARDSIGIVTGECW